MKKTNGNEIGVKIELLGEEEESRVKNSLKVFSELMKYI